MNLETGKILLQVFFKKERCLALRISFKSSQVIPRADITFLADRCDLNAPVNDVLIKTDFTKISPEANDLALRQDISLNLEGQLPPLLFNKCNVSLQSNDLIRGLSIGVLKFRDSAFCCFQLLVYFLKTAILCLGYLFQFLKIG